MTDAADAADAIAELRARELLAPIDEHFARTLGRIGGEARPAVLLAAALASRQVGQGHVCLDLSRAPTLFDEADGAVEPPGPAPRRWRELLRTSPLVSEAEALPLFGGEARPLVLDGQGRLYLRRFWLYERELAEAIRLRAAGIDDGVDERALRDGLGRLFGETASDGGADWQRVAALTAVLRRFTVITGGPGTGKTTTVAKVLALLSEQARARGERPPRALLVAPTGKAAARLGEAVRRAKPELACAADVRAAIPDEAATIHRALGVLPWSDGAFRHGREHPLLADVVVVDEASMVDLALMSRLVAAVPERARLILLGDADQLASVEAGAVLGDIANAGAARAPSKPWIERVAGLSGDRLPELPGAPERSSLADCIVELRRSRRYAASSAIARLAAAIRSGDPDAAAEALRGGDAELELVEPRAGRRPGPRLAAVFAARYAAILALGDPAAALDALGRFRVLCAHRRGPFGVEALNQLVEAALRERGRVRARPILVTANDYSLELFNGDVGIVAQDADGARLAFFPGAGGGLRTLSPARLPAHEPVWAMSVHKSQGSEFEEAAVILPDQPTPVLTRELLYTAVTRASRRIEIHARLDVVRAAVRRPIDRSSGLRGALWSERR